MPTRSVRPLAQRAALAVGLSLGLVLLSSCTRSGKDRVGASADQGGKDQPGDLWRSPGGMYASNEPIPLLCNMPEQVKRQMPASQKELVEKVEEFRRRLEPAKEAANDFALEDIRQGVRSECRRFLQDYWKRRQDAGGLDGWVGQFWVQEGHSTDIAFQFGVDYMWLTHGGKYPFAKDPACAYIAASCLYQIIFNKVGMSDAAKAGVSKLHSGDWVQVEAELVGATSFGRFPEVSIDAKKHFSVTGGYFNEAGIKLRDIKPIAAP